MECVPILRNCRRKNFIGIQKVLVEEINNSDSKKYAILTTTDSFYRYKEAVKELISQILRENDQKREQLVKERTGLVEELLPAKETSIVWNIVKVPVSLCIRWSGNLI